MQSKSVYVIWATYDDGSEKLAIKAYFNKPRADEVVATLNRGETVRTRCGLLTPEAGAVYTAEHEMTLNPKSLKQA